MRTSVIEVHDMLSVLSVDEVEKRIGAVPSVESVTVNYAAGSATVRYDETRLEVGDIKSAVRQRGYESVAPAAIGEGHEDPIAPVAPAGAGAVASGTARLDQGLSLPTSPPDPAPLATVSAPAPVDVASTKPQDQAAVDTA
jgi:P-type Cu2+ transporter